jgi:GNAT superfamily N-acetyltransferase
MSKITVTTRNSDPQVMSWDTSFWKQRVGRATSLDGLGEWAVANTVGLMCLLVDADDPAEIQRAEEIGYRFMDVRVTLTMETKARPSWARLVRAEDTAKLQAIARDAFHLTRFYADPTLDDERCDDLYAEWTRSLCAGAADIVLVVEENGFPVGYITVDRDGANSEIGLVAVAADFRGRQLGTVLVNGAIDWAHSHGAETIRVVTQGRNVGALRTFEGCGFRVSNTQVWLHRRFGEKP